MASDHDDETLDPRWHGAVIPIEHWHFHSQLLKRYGFVLGPGDFSHMLKDIKNGHAMLIQHKPSGHVIYSVRIRSRKRHIYVLVAGRNVITAWPPSKRFAAIRRKLRISKDSE